MKLFLLGSLFAVSASLWASLPLPVAAQRGPAPVTGYPDPMPSPSADFPIVVSLTTGKFAGGDLIPLTLTLTNETPGKTLTDSPYSPGGYRYQVSRLAATGKLIPVGLTAYGRYLHSPEALFNSGGSFDTGWLLMQPGEARTLRQPVVINRIFDMSLSGTYTIQVTQQNQIEGKPILLSARPVTVVVN